MLIEGCTNIHNVNFTLNTEQNNFRDPDTDLLYCAVSITFFFNSQRRAYLSLASTSSVIPLLKCGSPHQLQPREPACSPMDGWGPWQKPIRKLWDVNGAAWWAEWVGGCLCRLPWGEGVPPAAEYPKEQRSWCGTCWNFFPAMPVSMSCGSIWGGSGSAWHGFICQACL